MDDYTASVVNFELMFNFLYKKYFPRVAFGPIYLSGYKIIAFINSLKLLEF